MAKRISLHEFQAGLARRLAEARDTRASACLGIQAGKRHWLVDLTEAGEILAVPPLAPVPLSEHWFRGLASVRGNLFGVVDFAAFHGDQNISPVGHARLLLVGVRHNLNCALLVTRALGLRSLEDFELLPSSPDADQPEHLKGERLTPATDLYAVGLVFYAAAHEPMAVLHEPAHRQQSGDRGPGIGKRFFGWMRDMF